MTARAASLWCAQWGCLVAMCLPTGNAAAQSSIRGQQLIESRCAACHSLDEHRVGPALRDVVGRKAGKTPGFDYSPALAAATHTWDNISLKKWLTNPETVVPEQVMNYRLDQPQDRDDVVAFLASLSTKSTP
jgi:cytochrome c